MPQSFIVAGNSWVRNETKALNTVLVAASEVERQRAAKNIPKHIQKGFDAALAHASSIGVNRQTVTEELGGIRESLMECAERICQNSPPDEMKESPVRSRLRRKLEARTAASNEQVNLGPI